MEFIEGRIFMKSEIPNVSNKDRKEMYQSLIETLAKLHQINWKEIGLEGFGKPEKYYERQVKTWERQYMASKTHEIPEMTKLIDWLSKNIPKEDSLSTIVHGDFNLHNVIFHPTENRILAVLDWELSTIGHPLSDLSYLLMWYRIPPIPGTQFGLKGSEHLGIPTQDELLNEYKKLTNIQKIEDFHFYIAFSFLRIGGIAQGVYKRGLQGNSSQKNTQAFKHVTELIAKEGWKVIQEFEGTKGMNFLSSKKSVDLRKRISDFLDEHVIPFEHVYEEHVKKHCEGKHVSEWKSVPIMEEWKSKAKKEGLWNLFLSDKNVGGGLLNVEYAILAEEMFKKSFLAPEVFNCSAPDTGNMEILHLFGTKDQKEKWLKPLLNGDIRSCFGMTEPDVASSDATNIECSIKKVNDFYYINGKKWWISGAGDPRCSVW
jgi:acyl-CoA dehydrogenase family member 11